MQYHPTKSDRFWRIRTNRSKDLPRIELTADEVEQNETEVKVRLSGVLHWADNQQSFSATANMELEEGGWVICGIQ